MKRSQRFVQPRKACHDLAGSSIERQCAIRGENQAIQASSFHIITWLERCKEQCLTESALLTYTWMSRGQLHLGFEPGLSLYNLSCLTCILTSKVRSSSLDHRPWSCPFCTRSDAMFSQSTPLCILITLAMCCASHRSRWHCTYGRQTSNGGTSNMNRMEQ